MKKGIVQILLANILSLILGIVTGLFLPKCISVPDYGIVKSYHLYLSYIGFLHFGYIDGMYLLFGGKKRNEVLDYDYYEYLNTFKVFQGVMTIITLVVALMVSDKTLIIFALSLFPYNVTVYYKLLYQAIGEFKKYSLVLNLTNMLIVVGIIILLLNKVQSGYVFAIMYLVCFTIIQIGVDVSEYKYTKQFKGFACNFSKLLSLIKSGFPLMLGNFSAVLLTGLDRWCIKFFFRGTNDFSFYSFAVSMQAIVDALISPITIVLYNYLCDEENRKKVNKIRRLCLLAGIVLIAIVYPCKFIVNIFLKNYIEAITVMVWLFAAEALYIIIRGIYVNLYKAEKKQDKYFNKLIVVIVFALIVNILFYFLFHTKEAFAYATFVSVIFWLILCCMDFTEYSPERDEWIILICCILCYFATNLLLSPIIGMLGYIIFVIILSLLFFKEELIEIKNMIMEILNKRSSGVKTNE